MRALPLTKGDRMSVPHTYPPDCTPETPTGSGLAYVKHCALYRQVKEDLLGQ